MNVTAYKFADQYKELPACPCCSERGRAVPFDRRIYTGDKREYNLWICTICTAIISMTDLTDAITRGDFIKEQAESSDSYYAIDAENQESILARVNLIQSVEFLIEKYPEVPRGIYLEVGAGLGFMAAAAAKHFDLVFAHEISRSNLDLIHPFFENSDRIVVTDNLDDVKEFDVVCLFHVLEHMPSMLVQMKPLIDRLSFKGAFFFQIPLFSDRHLTQHHYCFLNTTSATILCHRLGLEMVGYWFDTDNEYMTCIARKN